jgi:hypothetical protein
MTNEQRAAQIFYWILASWVMLCLACKALILK